MVEKPDLKIKLEPAIRMKWRDLFLSPVSPHSRNRLNIARLPTAVCSVARRVVSIEDPSVMLLKNSKAGCTTLAQIMYFSKTGTYLDKQIHLESEVLTQGLRNTCLNLERMQGQDRFLFTSVRQPEVRCLSGFRNLIMEATNPAGQMHINALKSFGFDQKKSEEYNFDVFLDYVDQSLQKDRYRTDRHWREQSINTGIDLFSYDLVSRLESLPADLPVILDNLRVPRARWDEIRDARFNRSTKTNTVGTPQQRRRIQDIYKSDYEAFGY